jgi:hypothetical protein
MKKLTDYLIELLDKLQVLSLELKEMFYIWKDNTYFAKWMAKKEVEERDKTEQP